MRTFGAAVVRGSARSACMGALVAITLSFVAAQALAMACAEAKAVEGYNAMRCKTDDQPQAHLLRISPPRPAAALPPTLWAADAAHSRRHLSAIHLVSKGASGCTSSRKCKECEGDCDSNSDCDTELKCFQRNGKAKVQGCAGGGEGDVGDYDFCYKGPFTSQHVEVNKGRKLHINFTNFVKLTKPQRHGNDGGAIGSSGNLTIELSAFRNNSVTGSGSYAVDRGGAIHSRASASLYILRCEFFGNKALGSGHNAGGGAIYADRATALLVQNSTFTSNEATAIGGAIAMEGGLLRVVHSRFVGNTAGSDGGAIRCSYGSVAGS